MRPNKVETAVQLFCMLRTMLAGFSGDGYSIYSHLFAHNNMVSCS